MPYLILRNRFANTIFLYNDHLLGNLLLPKRFSLFLSAASRQTRKSTKKDSSKKLLFSLPPSFPLISLIHGGFAETMSLSHRWLDQVEVEFL